MTGTPWMDSRIRPNDEGEGRSHMFYTGTPLFSFGFGLSYTTFALSWPREPPLPLVIDLDHVDTQLPKVKFEVQLTNTGTVSGKEIVQAYWSPPSEVDSQLKRQLFAFEGATLNPGMSTILHFALPTDASTIASVNESGDQVFHPGTYTITLTRGHGKSLQIQVVIHGINVRHLSSFPSAWVEGHAVTVEACVEGTSDVVPHTEQFLLAYKQWQWVTTVQQDQGWIQHTASGMCLQQHVIGHLQNVSLQKCVENKQSQLWTHLGARISPVETDRLCLTTVASDSSQLRTDVHLSIDCTSPSSGWILLPDGLLRSNVPSLPDKHLDAEEGLCLAARSEGRYNNGA
jgi:Fibronectin type III-like domain